VIYTAGYLMFGVGEDGWSDESHGFDPPEFSRGGVAASKYVLQKVEAKKIKGCVIAPGFVYGPAGFFAELAGMIEAGKFRMPGGGRYYWSPIHIDDLAAAYVRALDGDAYGRAILVVDDQPMLMRDIAAAVAAALGVKPPGSAPKLLARLFIGGAMVDGITTSRRCRNGLARSLLGWSPRWPTLADGLPSVIGQLRAAKQRTLG
jgi:nucleoside-diphosphate-sugar epimerase